MEFGFKYDVYDLMEYCMEKLVFKNTNRAKLCQAKLLIKDKKEDEALEIYESILVENPNDSSVLKEKAHLLYNMNKGNFLYKFIY